VWNSRSVLLGIFVGSQNGDHSEEGVQKVAKYLISDNTSIFLAKICKEKDINVEKKFLSLP
jgi:hypothetical protein